MSENDLGAIIESLAALHHDIHQDEPGPQTVREAEAAIVKNGFQGLIMRLIVAGCSLRAIELSLFYFWHHLFVRSVNLEHEADGLPLEQTVREVVRLMRSITASIHDEGPSENMAALGDMVSQLKQAAFEMAEYPKSEEKIRADTEQVNTAVVNLINGIIDHGVHPNLVQNLLLYFWLRTSTIAENVDETLFQKIERNWVEVIDTFNPAYLAFIRAHVQ
ncbi:MAG: hypothetical protein ACR2PS_07650 [Pseudomonadales bacterium]